MSVLTIPSSNPITTRLRCLTPRIRELGDQPLFHLFRELAAMSSAAMDRIETYAAINPETLDRFGGRDLPPALKRVK